MNRPNLHKFAAFVSVPMLLAALSGCVGRAISETVGVVRGASGIYVPIQQFKKYLDDYPRFIIGEITDDFAGQVPQEFWLELPHAFDRELRERNIPNGTSGNRAIIRGRVIHLETNALSGVILGDFEEVVARVELYDPQTQEVIGTANVIGRSDDSVNRGLRKKAEGMAKGLAEWIDSYYPNDRKPAKTES